MNTKKTELEGGNKTEKEEIDTARTVHWGGGIISSIEGENLISYREGKKNTVRLLGTTHFRPEAERQA